MLPKGEFHRWTGIFDFFASTKLAVILCMTLAGGSVVGSIIYRGNTIVEDGPGFNIFSSPFFVLPAVALVANILLCFLKRVAGGGLRGRILLIGAHAFLVMAISGMMIDGLFGDLYTGYFPFKISSRAVYDWRDGRDRDLPFDIEVTSYSITRYPYLLKVGIRKNPGGEKVGLFVVNEGETLKIPGTGLVLQGVHFDPGEKKIIFEAFLDGQAIGNYAAGSDGSPPLGTDYVVVPVAFRDFGVRNMVAGLKISEGGRTSQYEVYPNNPAVYRGLNITLIETRLDKYNNLFVGLQMTKKPGEALFWAGTIGFFGLITTHFLSSKRRNRADKKEYQVDTA